MTDDQKSDPVNGQHAERIARADRILDAAAELVLRHGYKRVTIEDIANRAGIGKGTVYLHWKTRETLFYAVLVRESLDLIGDRLDAMRADPVEILPHRAVPQLLERSMRRPLVAAMLKRDTEVLGRLVEQKALDSTAAGIHFNREYLRILREHGLLRTDLDPDAQLYALEMIAGGFSLMEPWLPTVLDLPLETKAGTLAYALRTVLEPAGPPDPVALATAAAPVVEKFEQMHEMYGDFVHGFQPTGVTP